MFAAGFVVATMLWLGLWFFHAGPAQADVLRGQETELESCLAEKKACGEFVDAIEEEKEESGRRLAETNRKLDKALRSWGRCIKKENRSESSQQGIEAAPQS